MEVLLAAGEAHPSKGQLSARSLAAAAAAPRCTASVDAPQATALVSRVELRAAVTVVEPVLGDP